MLRRYINGDDSEVGASGRRCVRDNNSGVILAKSGTTGNKKLTKELKCALEQVLLVMDGTSLKLLDVDQYFWPERKETRDGCMQARVKRARTAGAVLALRLAHAACPSSCSLP